MSEPTTDDLARWAVLAEQATPGEWNAIECFDEDGRPDHWVRFPIGDSTLMDRLADAEFIASARTAVPRLLALVAAQAEQIAVLRNALGYISSPTMGLPPLRDAAEFAMTDATESAARMALRICIDQARTALRNGEAAP